MNTYSTPKCDNKSPGVPIQDFLSRHPSFSYTISLFLFPVNDQILDQANIRISYQYLLL